MHQFVSLAIMRGSFGITLYEILAREDPYVGEDEGQVLVFPLPSPSLLPMLTSSASNAARQTAHLSDGSTVSLSLPVTPNPPSALMLAPFALFLSFASLLHPLYSLSLSLRWSLALSLPKLPSFLCVSPLHLFHSPSPLFTLPSCFLPPKLPLN